jgi:hypothetical protein
MLANATHILADARKGQVHPDGEQDIIINPKSGLGDVTGEIDGRPVHVECKGGTINTTHPGQMSKLRRGLCEAVGLLMARQSDEAREIAAIPWTPVTGRLAKSMSGRCTKAGIEIALVKRDGSICGARILFEFNRLMVPLAGLEPATPALRMRCSTN